MGKAGRNEPCSCGSGKKYKRCCLRAAAQPARPAHQPDPSLPNEPFPPGRSLGIIAGRERFLVEREGNYRWYDGATGRSGWYTVRRRAID